MTTSFPSTHGIGDKVAIFGHKGIVGTVAGVHFTMTKVLYDIDLDIGGETMRDIDSTFVEAFE